MQLRLIRHASTAFRDTSPEHVLLAHTDMGFVQLSQNCLGKDECSRKSFSRSEQPTKIPCPPHTLAHVAVAFARALQRRGWNGARLAFCITEDCLASAALRTTAGNSRSTSVPKCMQVSCLFSALLGRKFEPVLRPGVCKSTGQGRPGGFWKGPAGRPSPGAYIIRTIRVE